MLFEYLFTNSVNMPLNGLLTIIPALIMVGLPLLVGGIVTLFTRTDAIDIEFFITDEQIKQKAFKQAQEEYKSIFGGEEDGTNNQTNQCV